MRTSRERGVTSVSAPFSYLRLQHSSRNDGEMVVWLPTITWLYIFCNCLGREGSLLKRKKKIMRYNRRVNPVDVFLLLWRITSTAYSEEWKRENRQHQTNLNDSWTIEESIRKRWFTNLVSPFVEYWVFIFEINTTIYDCFKIVESMLNYELIALIANILISVKRSEKCHTYQMNLTDRTHLATPKFVKFSVSDPFVVRRASRERSFIEGTPKTVFNVFWNNPQIRHYLLHCSIRDYRRPFDSFVCYCINNITVHFPFDSPRRPSEACVNQFVSSHISRWCLRQTYRKHWNLCSHRIRGCTCAH